MPNKKFHKWLKTVREPSGRLHNVLARICESDNLDPTEITKEIFLSQKGAGIMTWGEFVGLRRGLDHKILYGRAEKMSSLEIRTGSLWEVRGEVYELREINITEIRSPTEFKTVGSFRSKTPDRINPIFFQEEIQRVLIESDVYRPYIEVLEKSFDPKSLSGRIYYTVGNSNKKKWFEISETLMDFKRTKDGKNHLEYYYPFKACFSRFISRRIKGINPLSDGQYATLEEFFKRKYR